MPRSRTCARIALCTAAALLVASAASARTERFRWTHSDIATVTSFKLYWGTASQSYGSSLNVGLPPKDSMGAFYYDLVVPDTGTVYASVSALSGTLEGAKSNEISRTATTSGGTTTPPSGTATAAVTGFALWNALTDTLVDGSFANNDSIPDAIRNCASIEIKTNTYLTASGSGSVKKVFDGQDRGCTGTGVENGYPYAWEDGGAVGQFACAPSLATVGTHSLTVTPYDGDNCTGAVGTPVTLTFSVTGSTASGGTGLGAPGQPYIVP